MSSERGGRKVRIVFDSNQLGEVCFKLIEIAYPHSNHAKANSGCGEWVRWEQKCFHRPAQAFKELFFALRDLELIDNAIGVSSAAEYWAKDMDSSRENRLALIEDYKTKLLKQ